jgi:branched-chain amino acid transport system substrate-binding protein
MLNHKTSSMYCWMACFLGCLAVLVFSSSGYAKEENVGVGVVAAMKNMQGEQTWNGAEIAAEEINAAGGIKVGDKSYRVVLKKADSNEWANIADSTGAMERVITADKVKMVLGGYRSEAVLAMQEVSAEYKTMYFSIGAGHGQIPGRLVKDYETYKYWFRGGKPWSFWGIYALLGMLDSVVGNYKDKLGIEKPKVAIISEKVLWADEALQYLRKVLPEKLGLEVVGVWQPSHAANDLRAELNAVKSSGAHILIHLVSGSAGTVLGRQWGGLKIPAALIGYNGEGMKKAYWSMTEGNCEYEALVDYMSSLPINERSSRFWKKYIERYNEYPMECALSYNSLFTWKEAVERAGTFNPDKVIPELLKSNFEGPGGNWRYYPKDSKYPHDIVFAPDACTQFGVQWRKGEKKTFWPDGRPLMGDQKWKGVRFKGTVDYELPTCVVDYWKK